MPLASDIARRAREIIHDPASWTPTASARDESGAAVSPLSPGATKFCGLGALVKAAHELRFSERWLVDIFGASPLGDLVRSNHLGHVEVLAHLAKLGGYALAPETGAAPMSIAFDEAARWRERAREIANITSLLADKQKLREMAENYEQLAKSAEANSQKRLSIAQLERKLEECQGDVGKAEESLPNGDPQWKSSSGGATR
jgi:hypothetical protein